MSDEGVFVDSNYSVDVSKCIIICTTNYRNEEAEKNLGMPIYLHFSKVFIIKPIISEDKPTIAHNCYSEAVSGGYQTRCLWLQNGYKNFVKYIIHAEYMDYLHKKRTENTYYYDLAKSDTRVGVIDRPCKPA